MKNFEFERPFIEHQFETVKYDENTGLSPEKIVEQLKKFQEEQGDEPWRIVHAKAFAYILDNAQLEINEHTPFPIKFNTGVDHTNFATSGIFVSSVFAPRRAKVLQSKFPEKYAKSMANNNCGRGAVFTDFWHTVPDWNYLLENGFSGILNNAEKSREKFLANNQLKEVEFLDTVIICYNAIIRLLNRMYDYSLKFNVSEFSSAIKNLAKNPPETLYEVMLFSILYVFLEEVGVERARTLGPIDRLYYSFYKKDLENGKTINDIEELFKYYFMHFTSFKRYAQQPFSLCGCDMHGNDYTNELSHLILEAYDSLKILDPKIHIRYHENLDDKIYTKALSMIRKGNNSICILNDKTVFEGYKKIGVPIEDSQNYVVLGCYEPIIMGKEEGEIAPHRFNLAKCIEYAINGGKDIVNGFQHSFESPMEFNSFEEFYAVYLKHVDEEMDFDIDFVIEQGKIATEIWPAPIYSSSFKDCIEKGKDVHEYPLKYNNLSLKPVGLATAVDSLVAIKKFVFDTKQVSLDQMRKALVANWEGYEDLRHKIINDKEKYGNNLPLADEMMVSLTKHLSNRYLGRKLERGGAIRLALDSINYSIIQGGLTSATPDGRKNAETLSKNMRPSDGLDRGGITAFMQSVLKIDQADYLNGAVLDFIVHPSTIEGEKGLDDFKKLVKIYFANGGLALQGNVVSGETLKQAQLYPEKYATLQIRVCGWNEYFVKMNKNAQDIFIKQCEREG